MPTSASHLFEEASHLDEGDRAALAGLLLESLNQPPSPGVEAAWAEEIERRVRQLDSGEIETVPWEDVKKRLWLRRHRRGNHHRGGCGAPSPQTRLLGQAALGPRLSASEHAKIPWMFGSR